MSMIQSDIDTALQRADIARARVRTVLPPAWTTDWISEDGRRKVARVWHRTARPRHRSPQAVGVEQVACPHCGSAETQLLFEFDSTS
jgi:ring-1,2-phenylacetyl-CoA epoxidase subunit PaaD